MQAQGCDPKMRPEGPRRPTRLALGVLAALALTPAVASAADGLPIPGASQLPGTTLPVTPPPVGEPSEAGGGAGANAGAGGTTVGAGTNGGGGAQGGGQNGSTGQPPPPVNIVLFAGVFNSYQSAAPSGAGGFISPFPVVHIRGRMAGSRVQVSRLAVSAPSGAKAKVTCRGGTRKGCSRTASKSAATSGSTYVRFRNAERTLRSGAKIEVAVTKPGLIGKFTRFTIRSRKAPLRSDRCIQPGASGPSACP